MKKLGIALLFLLAFISSFGQAPGKSTLVYNSVDGFYYHRFFPADSTGGLHPLFICANGAGELGSNNSAAYSTGAYARSGTATFRFLNGARGNIYTTAYVLEIHGNPDSTTIKNAVAWCKANMPYLDTLQMQYMGLSLSGGRAAEIATTTLGLRFNGVLGASPVYNVGAYTALPAFASTGLHAWLVDCNNDENGSTNWVVQEYATAIGQGYGGVPFPKLYFLTTSNPITGHIGAWNKSMDTATTTWYVDSSRFAGHTSATNVAITVTNIYEQMLAFRRSGGNVSPTSNAGSNQNITTATFVNLTGSGTDPDGTITGYLWTQLSGPSSTIVSNTSASTSITGMNTNGTYVYNLRVTDNNGATGNSSVTIIKATGVIGTGIGLRADYYNNETQTNPIVVTDTVATIDWFNLGTIIKTGITLQHFSTRFSGLLLPSYTETYKIYFGSDAGGTVWINGVPIINNVTPHGYVEDSATVSLTAGVAQSIRVDGFNVLNNYTFQLKWASTSTPKAIIPQTQLTPDIPATVSAGANQSLAYSTTSYTATASASDADGYIQTYAWTQTSGTTATISSPSTLATNFTGLTPGTRVFKLTVTDNVGVESSSSVTITVNAAPAGGASYTLGTTSGNLIIQPSSTSPSLVPGDTLHIPASGVYGNISFKDLVGNINNHITVIFDLGSLLTSSITFQQPTIKNCQYLDIKGMTHSNWFGTLSYDSAVSNITWFKYKIQNPQGSYKNQPAFRFGTSTNRAGMLYSGNINTTFHDILYDSAFFEGYDNSYAIDGIGADNLYNLPAYFEFKNSYIGKITNSNTATGSPGGISLTAVAYNIHDNLFDSLMTTTASVRGVHGNWMQLYGYGNIVKNKFQHMYANNVRFTPLMLKVGTEFNGNQAHVEVHDNVSYDHTSYSDWEVSGNNAGVRLSNGFDTCRTVIINNTTYRTNRDSYLGDYNGKMVDVFQDSISIHNNVIVAPEKDRTFVTTPNYYVYSGSGFNAIDTGGNRTYQIFDPTVFQDSSSFVPTVSSPLRSAADASTPFGSVSFNNVTRAGFRGIGASEYVNPGVPPVSIPGPDLNLRPGTTAAAIVGSGTDSDGTIAAYLWTKVSGATCTLVTPTASTLLLTGLASGSYVFSLRVTDNNGNQDTKSMTLTIQSYSTQALFIRR